MRALTVPWLQPPPANVQAVLDEFHRCLGIAPLHEFELARRYGAQPCLHIGNRAGCLTVRVQRDSAGIEVTVEQHIGDLERVSAGTRLLLQHPGDLAAVRRPNRLTDELHIGDAWFEIPRNYTPDAVCWLRQQAPRHTRPFDPTEVTA